MISFLCLATPLHSQSQDLMLFELKTAGTGDQKIAFVSFSELLVDTCMSILEGFDKSLDMDGGYSEIIKLDEQFRKHILTHAGISEKDCLFIFDFKESILKRFTIKDFTLAAILNPYSSLNDSYLSSDLYMITLFIDLSRLGSIPAHKGQALAAIHPENPFSVEGMHPMQWKKVEISDFPEAERIITDSSVIGFERIAGKGTSHLYENDSLRFFAHDFHNADNRLIGRTILVLDLRTEEVVYFRSFTESEGISVAHLNREEEKEYALQWAGRLLKGKPIAFFGFQHLSFSCHSVILLTRPVTYIPVLCDSRH